LFVVFIGGWVGYEIVRFVLGEKLFSTFFITLPRFLVLCDLYFFFTYGVSFGPLEFGYRVTRAFDSGWLEYFVGQAIY